MTERSTNGQPPAGVAAGDSTAGSRGWHTDPGWGNLGTAVRRYWPLILLVGLIGATAAAIGAYQRSIPYTTSAELNVEPLPTDDETFIGLEAFRSVGDLTQTTETIAALLDDAQIAEAAAERLGDGWTTPAVMEAVTVVPFGQSSVVLVQAETDDAGAAVRVADAYAVAAVETRRRAFLKDVGKRIAFLEERKRRLAKDDYGGQNDAGSRLNLLRAVESQGDDPTLSLGGRAEPAQATAIPAALLVAAGGAGGLLLGALAAVALTIPNRRLSTAEEAVALYHLPVLARLPRRVGPEAVAVGGADATPEVEEMFRMFAARVERRGVGRVIMVASASRGDGRTTVALGLTRALAQLGYSVVAVDCDVEELGLSSALRSRSAAPKSRSAGNGADGRAADLSNPRVLVPADRQDEFLRQLPEVLDDARATTDYVIVDTAPLGEDSDALRVAAHADDVILVARTRHTDRHAFTEARDTLEQLGARPVGLVVFGRSAQPAARPARRRRPSRSERPTASERLAPRP